MKTEKIIACVAIGSLCVLIISLALGIYKQWYIQQCSQLEELVNKGNDCFDNGEYKRAVKYYDDALRIQKSDTYVWRNKGFALFNFGIDNESVCIERYKGPQCGPPYSHYAKKLIDHYNSSYQPTEKSHDYFERSFQCFEEAVCHNPNATEMWLYKGVVGLYLSPSPICNPVKDFDETLKIIDNLPPEQKSPPLRDIESCALYGKRMAYSKLGQRETFMTHGDTVKKTIKKDRAEFINQEALPFFYFFGQSRLMP